MTKELFYPISVLLIGIVILVNITATWAATEITIEYNVTELCAGNIVLSLNPTTVLRGGQVTASASGLSTCNGKTVFFRQTSCSGTQVSSCSVSGAGCTGNFVAPSTGGSYTYYACIDKSDPADGDFVDAGESDSATLTVQASTPSATTPVFSPLTAGALDLMEGGRTFLKFSTTITNADGAGNVSTCSGYLWGPTVPLPYTTANAKYTNSTCVRTGCSGTGTTCQCECGFNLWYYDSYGTWTGNVTARTVSNTQDLARGTFVVNKNNGVSVTPTVGIVFSNLLVGDVNRPASNNPVRINNTGNSNRNVTIYGTDHVGVDNSSWVIKVGNMTYNSSVTGMTTLRSLTTAPTSFYPTGGIPVYPDTVAPITDRATFYIYNYLSIPTGFKAQTYRGTYYIEVGAL